MRNLGLVLVLCGAVGLVLAPAGANAFEIQGEGQGAPDEAANFQGLPPVYTLPQFNGSSLAMPYNSSDSSFSGSFSDYGNDIPIPGPGIDQPSPAWASSPFFR
jgi:hypothetical protein